MFGDFFYITKKDGLCAVERCGGCFFTPNEFDAEKYLKRDLEEFSKLKGKVPLDKIMSKLEESDVIVFSDLDNMQFTTYSGSELKEFKQVIESYKLIDKEEVKATSNFYTKRCDNLTKLFELKISNIELDDVYAPKYWIVTLNTGIKKINSIKTIEEFSSLLSNFKTNISSFKDKPSKWEIKEGKIILYYSIKSKIINFFNAKKKYNNEYYPVYKFENYIVQMSSLHTKADGSLYVSIQQLHTEKIPKVDGYCTTFSFNNATPEVYEKFEKFMFDEYNCVAASSDRDNHRIYFNVLD
jgi:hypothetical protein